jgi:hypothetical protein
MTPPAAATRTNRTAGAIGSPARCRSHSIGTTRMVSVSTGHGGRAPHSPHRDQHEIERDVRPRRRRGVGEHSLLLGVGHHDGLCDVSRQGDRNRPDQDLQRSRRGGVLGSEHHGISCVATRHPPTATGNDPANTCASALWYSARSASRSLFNRVIAGRSSWSRSAPD